MTPSCGSRVWALHRATNRTCTLPTLRNVNVAVKSATWLVYLADAPSVLS